MALYHVNPAPLVHPCILSILVHPIYIVCICSAVDNFCNKPPAFSPVPPQVHQVNLHRHPCTYETREPHVPITMAATCGYIQKN